MKSLSKSKKPPRSLAALLLRAREPSRQSRKRLTSQKCMPMYLFAELMAATQASKPQMKAASVMWPGVTNAGTARATGSTSLSFHRRSGISSMAHVLRWCV
jgi:predicted lipoprotein with Yx(FWY)xxD motif